MVHAWDNVHWLRLPGQNPAGFCPTLKQPLTPIAHLGENGDRAPGRYSRSPHLVCTMPLYAFMQYSVHPPSPFINTHWHQLLPDWSCPVESILVVLQPCSCDLAAKTPATDDQKQRLRQQFLEFGNQVAHHIRQRGYLVEMFDPRTGLPLFSQPGSLPLDDVAVAQACLGYQTRDRWGCSLILHPTWGSAVYPSTLLSSAPPAIIETILHQSHVHPHPISPYPMIAGAVSGRYFRRSECHQSLTSGGKSTE